MSTITVTKRNEEKHGFKPIDAIQVRRLIMSVEGGWKTGKTHLALTAPRGKMEKLAGLGILNFDIGLEGVVQKFMNGSDDIIASDFETRFDSGNKVGQDLLSYRADRASEVVQAFKRDWRYGLAHLRSLVVDTASELWELVRMAEFGKLDQVKPHHYGPVNRSYRDLFREAFDSECNVIFLHKTADEYIDDKRTGRQEMRGFKETPYITQVHVRTSRTMDRDEWTPPEDIGFRLEILSCRQNPAIVGEVLSYPMNTFPWLASMVFEGTAPEDWE